MTNSQPADSSEASTTERVGTWMFFSVGIALIPLLASYLYLLIKTQSAAYIDVVGRGELFLVIIALSGAAIGDLVTSRKVRNNYRWWSAGFTLIILLLASFLYAAVADTSGGNMAPSIAEREQISSISSILFLIGLLSCGCCIAVSE